MKKKLLLPALLLIVVILAGCAPQESPEVDIPTLGSQSPQANPMQVETSVAPVNEPIVTLPEGIDPSAEEDSGSDVELIGPVAQQQAGLQQAQNVSAVSGTANPYAGSSPIPLNPIDMPRLPPAPNSPSRIRPTPPPAWG